MEQTERVIMTLKRAEWSEMTMAIHPNVCVAWSVLLLELVQQLAEKPIQLVCVLPGAVEQLVEVETLHAFEPTGSRTVHAEVRVAPSLLHPPKPHGVEADRLVELFTDRRRRSAEVIIVKACSSVTAPSASTTPAY